MEEFTKVTLNKYDEMMTKVIFYDVYVAGKIKFADEKVEKRLIDIWTTDNAVAEVEKYYRKLTEDYKKRIRKRFTLKFWKWKITISRKA